VGLEYGSKTNDSKMIENRKYISEKILEEAGRWVARDISGDMSRAERDEMEKWLDADLNHQDAYIEIYKTSSLIDGHASDQGRHDLAKAAPEIQSLIDECNDLDTVASKEKQFFPSYSSITAIAAMLFVTLISGIFLFQGNPAATQYSTDVSELETVMLDDGSIITLNTSTRLSVALSDTERRIFLDYGEAYFDVAKDHDRPFKVVTGKGIVRAVGTAFNIKKRAEMTKVTVTEGIVEVKNEPFTGNMKPTSALSEPLSLTAGADLTIIATGVENNQLSPLEMEQTVSWRTGMLHFNGMQLSNVVKELQYYARKEIILTGENVGDLVVGGSLNVKNIPAFLKGLELTFPIKVIERDSVIILSYDKAPPKSSSL